MHKLLVFLMVNYSHILTYETSTLYFLFQVCLVIGLTLARQDKGRSHFKRKEPSRFDHKSSWMNLKLSKFCSNKTVATAYLTQILSVIDKFQENSSHSAILKLQSDNVIQYLKDTTHQELLRSDCEAFINGLKAAKKADKTVERTQKQLAREIRKQIKQAARNVNNGNGFHELDDLI